MFENTKKFCDSFLELGVPGFDLAVYKNGECILRYMNGYSDLENKKPMTGKERYNIYSCSKPITCAAAMQLYEKGLFSLDDKLSCYLPEFDQMTVKAGEDVKKAEKPILIRDLFTMIAGFSYKCKSPQLMLARSETDGRCPTRETVKYLAKEPLIFEPGERWEYSLCHDVLAALVEVISGQPFHEYVKENIFVPLGMNDSTFMLADSELESIAPQYRFENGKAVNIGKSIDTYKFGSEYASGGAGCISTVDDYIKFLEALRKGDSILKKETVDLMATNQLTPEQLNSYASHTTHGYGLGVRTPKNDSIFTDFGWGGAAGAFLAVDRENGISLYHAQHMIFSPNQEIRGWVYRFVMADLGKEEFAKLIGESSASGEYNFTF